MINKKAIKRIEELCKGEIKFVEENGDSVSVMLPYSNFIMDIDVEGESEEDQVESFIEGTNLELEAMINHIEECKL